MHPPTTIRTDDPRELLALIPFQLGFHPDESIVAVSLRGRRSRVGLVARTDLADLADPAGGPQVARSLVAHLVADGATGLALVLYTDEDLQSDEGAGRGRAARLHLQAAADYFLGEADCWVVGPGGYFNLDCEDRTCCPLGGRPLSGLESTRVGAQMVLSGATVAASRDELGRVTTADAAARRSARRAAGRWAVRGQVAADAAEAHRWRREGLAAWRTELMRASAAFESSAGTGTAVGQGAGRGPSTWLAPSATVLGRLQAAAADVLVRDAVLLTVLGADRVADAVVAGRGADEVGRALGALVDPREGVAPPQAMLAGASQLLHQVVGHTTRRLQVPALTLLAVLAWWNGDGARSGAYVDAALGIDPGYRLAGLIHDALLAGMPPGWLRAGAGESA
ncbi:MAG TPA: DUF4192 domain-containing protein [Actinotalea sp.]